MSVAATIRPLIHGLLGPDLPIRVTCWDGSSLGPVRCTGRAPAGPAPGPAPAAVGAERARPRPGLRQRRRRDPRATSWPASTRWKPCPTPTTGPRCTSTQARSATSPSRRCGWASSGPPPTPPPEEIAPAWPAPLEGPRRAGDLPPLRRRQRLLPARPGPLDGLLLRLLRAGAVRAVHAGGRAARQARPRRPQARPREPGMRVLDVGCGWGSFAHPRRPRVRRRGRRRHALARAGRPTRAGASPRPGLADRVEIRVQDYRDVDRRALRRDRQHRDGRARRRCPARASTPRHFHALLARGPAAQPCDRPPARAARDRAVDRTSFIDRYVFPDGELQPLATMVDALETRRLRGPRRRVAARALRAAPCGPGCQPRGRTGTRRSRCPAPGRARVWRLYMAGSALGFESNRLGVNQVLAVRPG